MVSEITALSTAEKLYQNYCARVQELSKQGRKIIGYLCAMTPVEIIAAAGFIPFRIKGDVNEPITKADTQMETIVCPLVRSCYDMTLKGNYNILSGLVIPHACDSICRTYDIWKNTINVPYTHLIDTPHGTDASSMAFFKNILDTFRKSIGNYAGKEITDEDLRQAINKYNENRAAVRRLFEFRKLDPSPISGSEITRVLVATMSIPVEESTRMLNGVIEEVKKRQPSVAKKAPRIMVVGAQVDDAAFIKIIEDAGASVVIDDLCPGTREFWADTPITSDPMNGLAERYLKKVKCGRTYREQKVPYEEYQQDRFGHIGEFIKDFKVDGVILYIYKYCDPFGFEVPALKAYIQKLETPVLYLEDEYSMSRMPVL